MICKHSKLTKSNRDSIQAMISNKIDKEEMLSLLEMKSNKNDMNLTQKSLDMLHRQSKHLIVLIIELIRQMTSKHNDTVESRNAREAK